jgi:acyl carrier protein
MEIAAKVKEIISQQLDVDPEKIEDGASFIDDLGADSLAIVELVLAFEEQFDLSIPDEDTEKIRTVADAVGYITQHAGK